jgi:multidrug resistance efflux pump
VVQRVPVKILLTIPEGSKILLGPGMSVSPIIYTK